VKCPIGLVSSANFVSMFLFRSRIIANKRRSIFLFLALLETVDVRALAHATDIHVCGRASLTFSIRLFTSRMPSADKDVHFREVGQKLSSDWSKVSKTL
jgi:hypothetical protein